MRVGICGDLEVDEVAHVRGRLSDHFLVDRLGSLSVAFSAEELTHELSGPVVSLVRTLVAHATVVGLGRASADVHEILRESPTPAFEVSNLEVAPGYGTRHFKIRDDEGACVTTTIRADFCALPEEESVASALTRHDLDALLLWRSCERANRAVQGWVPTWEVWLPASRQVIISQAALPGARPTRVCALEVGSPLAVATGQISLLVLRLVTAASVTRGGCIAAALGLPCSVHDRPAFELETAVEAEEAKV